MQTFRITQDDITQGEPKSVNNCAGARAIKAQYPEAHVTVTPHCVHIDNTVYPTPAELAEFIYRYDKEMTVDEMEFTLTPA